MDKSVNWKRLTARRAKSKARRAEKRKRARLRRALVLEREKDGHAGALPPVPEPQDPVA